jgi:hypothetical protein
LAEKRLQRAGKAKILAQYQDLSHITADTEICSAIVLDGYRAAQSLLDNHQNGVNRARN